MKVRVYATLRQIVGMKEVEVEGEAGDTVRDVLHRLIAAHPGLEGHILDDEGHLRRTVNVFVQGRSIKFREGLDTVLQESDELSIFPPVAGGQG
ncbi:MAG: ubiquitin-like small modifier protein 1 [Anaerolineae bacterium]